MSFQRNSKRRKVTVFGVDRGDQQQVSLRTLNRWASLGHVVSVPDDGEDDDTTCHLPETESAVKNTSPSEVEKSNEEYLSSSDESAPSKSDKSVISSESEHNEDIESVFEDDDSKSVSGGNEDSESVSSDSSDSERISEKRSQMLYVDSDKTTDEGILTLLDLYVQRKWSKRDLKDTLSGFLSLIPKPNNMPKSLHLLLKYVEDLAPGCPETIHLYCTECLSFVVTGGAASEHCGSTQLSKFYSFSIKDQIKYLFEQRNLAQALDSFCQQSDTDNCISDICDGSEYKKVKFEGKYNLTLLWNTDGIKPGMNTKLQLWPVLYTICELPPQLRSSFIMVSAVFCDERKPCMNILLKPLVQSLQTIRDEGGVSWTHPKTLNVIESQVIAPVLCADGPARADVQNIQHPVADYACNSCEQKREKISEVEAVAYAQAKGSTRPRQLSYFTFQENPAPLRNGRRMDAQGRKAGRMGKPIRGVKGSAIISEAPSLDRAVCVSSEYMHCVCLGVVLQFIVLWFCTKGPWNISKFSSQINQILTIIAPPDFVTRLPRRLSDYKIWKAHELRAWLLYFSLPCIYKFLPKKYFEHWTLLSNAIFLLLQDKIYKSDIHKAEEMLKLFVKGIGKLYRKKDYSYNVHQLLHLPLSVERWGPLWATSAFQFENYNGVLSNLLHGPNKKDKELVNNLKLLQGIAVLKRNVEGEKRAKEEGSSGTSNVIILLNKCSEVDLEDDVQNVLVSSRLDQVVIFSRASIKKTIYSSLLYKRQVTRNNFTVQFEVNDVKRYGEVFCYLQDNAGELFAVVKEFKVIHHKMFIHSESRSFVKHIIPVGQTSVILVRLDCIKCKIIRVDKFVCLVPNYFEKNL